MLLAEILIIIIQILLLLNLKKSLIIIYNVLYIAMVSCLHSCIIIIKWHQILNSAIDS